MFEKMTYQQSVKDYGVTPEQVKAFFKTSYAYIHDDGDVWVGKDGDNCHLLSEGELKALVTYVESTFPNTAD